MSEVKKAVRQFKRQLGKKLLCFESVADVARIEGYSISFYRNGEDNPLLRKIESVEDAKEVKALTVVVGDEKYIFVDSEASPQNILYSLLHEVGHILLNHLEANSLTSDKRLNEMQAEAVAYTILTSCKRKY